MIKKILLLALVASATNCYGATERYGEMDTTSPPFYRASVMVKAEKPSACSFISIIGGYKYDADDAMGANPRLSL